MKKHNGMRPHDIMVLLKIAAKGKSDWLMKDLAQELVISQSEISESLNRSMLAGLLASDKRFLMRSALLEFLQYGMPYVFPQRPGAIVRGMVTAHSAPPLNNLISGSDQFVWPWAKGQHRGQSIEPLHPSAPIASQNDTLLHELLALVDCLRLGRIREQNLALEQLKIKI
ncbi:MAG: hypothetical protein ABFS38_12590 [Bacteroidota bacterium]